MPAPNHGRHWTKQDDDFLIRWGRAAGYAYVASHDLLRSPEAGKRRIRYLRKTRPAFVKRIEGEEREWEAKQRADFEAAHGP